jgi:hypothetical protein
LSFGTSKITSSSLSLGDAYPFKDLPFSKSKTNLIKQIEEEMGKFFYFLLAIA